MSVGITDERVTISQNAWPVGTVQIMAGGVHTVNSGAKHFL